MVHWEQEEEALPGWLEAVRRMCEEGRPSRVRYPSPQHEGLAFRTPPLAATTAIRPSQAG